MFYYWYRQKILLLLVTIGEVSMSDPNAHVSDSPTLINLGALIPGQVISGLVVWIFFIYTDGGNRYYTEMEKAKNVCADSTFCHVVGCTKAIKTPVGYLLAEEFVHVEE